MSQDFSRQNLQGCSFKGQDLTGTDFSYADIRGADFTNAILRGANFSHVKAGLQYHRAIGLLLVSLLLAALSGLTLAIAAAWANYILTNLPILVSLILFALFCAIAICKSIEAALGAIAVAVAVTLATTVAGIATLPVAVSVPGAVVLAVTGTVAGALAVAVARIVAGIYSWALASAVGMAVTLAYAGFGVGTIAGTFILLGNYIGRRSLAKDKKYTLIRKIAITIATQGGTSFRGADLTDANFSYAILKNTDFRKTILKRIFWHKNIKTNWSIFDEHILAQSKQTTLMLTSQTLSDKLVILSIGDGDFARGFNGIKALIWSDGHPLPSIVTASLPPAPNIPNLYANWQSLYCGLELAYRIDFAEAQITNSSDVDSFNFSRKFTDYINNWLNSESFRPIRDQLLQKLNPYDEVRMIVETENSLLQRLPWHLWSFFTNYPKAEFAVSVPTYDKVEKSLFTKERVRILAILGKQLGIDLAQDRKLLEGLPNTECVFLVEPNRSQLNDYLWEGNWDILFFAGHSNAIGQININPTEDLTIPELKYALRTAIERGLQIAIFNSCDGLGLANQLASLHIPEIIVMREPVPDVVAQEFLKHFLSAFAGGKSFYLAVREAREKLQSLENDFPCASWLPVICQNPAEIPPTWESLRGF